jgi:shikimate kinase
MKIFLIGFMGCGKSTVGKILARKLELEFVDTDTIIEDLFKTPISEYFNFLGEKKFRETERKTLEEVIKHDDLVVSTGGGLPCFNNNIDVMNESGLTIYLKLSPAALFHRLISSKRKRPLLAGMNAEELKAYIETKLNEREEYYNNAKLIYSGESVNYDLFIEEVKKQF